MNPARRGTPTPFNRIPRSGRTRNELGRTRGLRYFWSMTGIEQSLLQTLLDLESAIATMRTASPKPNLLPLFTRIDEFAAQLPRGTNPDLLHYLHKKSYEKARLFLQDRDAENQAGNCRHI